MYVTFDLILILIELRGKEAVMGGKSQIIQMVFLVAWRLGEQATGSRPSVCNRVFQRHKLDHAILRHSPDRPEQ